MTFRTIRNLNNNRNWTALSNYCWYRSHITVILDTYRNVYRQNDDIWNLPKQRTGQRESRVYTNKQHWPWANTCWDRTKDEQSSPQFYSVWVWNAPRIKCLQILHKLLSICLQMSTFQHALSDTYDWYGMKDILRLAFLSTNIPSNHSAKNVIRGNNRKYALDILS